MKRYVVIGLICLCISLAYYSNSFFSADEKSTIKKPTIDVQIKNEPLNIYDKVYLSDVIDSINGTYEDKTIDTSEIGTKKITLDYLNDDGIDVQYEFDIEVKDLTPPIIWLNEKYLVAVNTKEFASKIMCGDNYDDTPVCTITGEYNLNKVGSYPLTFTAEDSSGNKTIQDFTLQVYDTYPYKNKVVYFEDILKNYKTSNTKIGVDVSEWQDDVDFSLLKTLGVEFAFIRVGGTKGNNGAYFLDKSFINNMKSANDAGIPVGVYFYSYASSEKQAIEEAKWVTDKIKDYQVDLEVVFDWECWSSFNKYKISFNKLNNVAKAFIEEINKSGYQGMLYSSKSYLEEIWYQDDYPIWLAHYTDKTTYEGKYKYWQLTGTGKISALSGYIDIDIMYE